MTFDSVDVFTAKTLKEVLLVVARGSEKPPSLNKNSKKKSDVLFSRYCVKRNEGREMGLNKLQ